MNDETRNEVAEQGVDHETPRSVSERKRQANRENAKKSTGPKTAGGKRNSSFNALKHGLLAQRIIVETDEDAKLLGRFAFGLHERYEIDGGIRNELLVELAFVDYWRHARGLDAENSLFSPTSPRGPFSNPISNPMFSANLFRYMTSNRRALIKTLDMFEEARDKRIHESQSADIAADRLRVPSRSGTIGGPTKKPPKPGARVSPDMTRGKKAA